MPTPACPCRKFALVDGGLKPDEVAFIHDAEGDATKLGKLTERCRTGEIKVLIGSTGKMGTGLNVQNRLSALHHVDGAYRPDQIEQHDATPDFVYAVSLLAALEDATGADGHATVLPFLGMARAELTDFGQRRRFRRLTQADSSRSHPEPGTAAPARRAGVRCSAGMP